MTTVTFLTEGKRIIGFDAKGHSGYAEAGSDIVCAAITSAVRLVDATVNDVLVSRPPSRSMKDRVPSSSVSPAV